MLAKRYAQGIQLIVCITIDGDEKNKGDAHRAMPGLLNFLDRVGLRGKVSWFLNQHDVNWVGRYPDLVAEILNRNDEVALHSHVETILKDYESLVRTISSSKEEIEAYCRTSGSDNYSVVSFRSGRLAKSIELLRVISDLGFRFDSSVRPGWSRNEIDTDDRDIPYLVGPYYLDPLNYKLPSLSPRVVLELPVSLYPYPPVVTKHSVRTAFLYVTLKHPYEFLGLLGLFSRTYIRILLLLLGRFPKVRFMKINEAGHYFISKSPNQQVR